MGSPSDEIREVLGFLVVYDFTPDDLLLYLLGDVQQQFLVYLGSLGLNYEVLVLKDG